MVEYSEQSEVSVLHNNSGDELAFIKETRFHFTSVSVQGLLDECSEHEGLDYCISPNVGRYYGLVTGPPPLPAMEAMEAAATERF